MSGQRPYTARPITFKSSDSQILKNYRTIVTHPLTSSVLAPLRSVMT